ncbi:hypothetical protein RBH26_14660 [Natronolimnohabitans sp. A-GB9]|uniref:hypothetical protein n=1 Tax=Natronolimnohabitans sp. A-GB9 TaxID=3069757 RepID=UPI0027B2F142|nr:hypothetical protein [Natronolimnohabitans sp. A-GB9]MDQ2051718.1 hypothetical protein [Natronolimnohabitans sp. A-GB9]
MSTSRSEKKKLIRELENDGRVQSVVKPTGYKSRSAWEVETEESTKMIWVTYSRFAGDSTAKESPFYGSTWDSINNLRQHHPLYLIFLGTSDEYRWTIPFPNFISRFDISEKKKDHAWKFNFDHGDNRNLLPEYRGIEPLFEY